MTKPRRQWTRVSVLLALSALLALSGCKADPNEEFIQGEWYYWNDHLGSIPAQKDQETWLAFSRGAYSMSGCCYIQSQEKGHYRVLESEDDSLTLELYDRQGHTNGMNIEAGETDKIKIEIDRTADTIRVSRATFTRAGP